MNGNLMIFSSGLVARETTHFDLLILGIIFPVIVLLFYDKKYPLHSVAAKQIIIFGRANVFFLSAESRQKCQGYKIICSDE